MSKSVNKRLAAQRTRPIHPVMCQICHTKPGDHHIVVYNAQQFDMVVDAMVVCRPCLYEKKEIEMLYFAIKRVT